MKYDLKKVEEIVYDVTIRGLAPKQGASAAPTPETSLAASQGASVEKTTESTEEKQS